MPLRQVHLGHTGMRIHILDLMVNSRCQLQIRETVSDQALHKSDGDIHLDVMVPPETIESVWQPEVLRPGVLLEGHGVETLGQLRHLPALLPRTVGVRQSEGGERSALLGQQRLLLTPLLLLLLFLLLLLGQQLLLLLLCEHLVLHQGLQRLHTEHVLPQGRLRGPTELFLNGALFTRE